jgi:hypothetical protein
MGRNPRRDPHDSAEYRQRRRLLLANAGPLTKCGRCGRLLKDHPPHRNGRPATWHADHVVNGDNRAPLILSASTCNTSQGGRDGNTRRWGNGNRPHREPGPHHPMHYNLVDATAATAAPCVRLTGSLCATCQSWHANNPTRGG